MKKINKLEKREEDIKKFYLSRAIKENHHNMYFLLSSSFCKFKHNQFNNQFISKWLTEPQCFMINGKFQLAKSHHRFPKNPKWLHQLAGETDSFSEL